MPNHTYFKHCVKTGDLEKAVYIKAQKKDKCVHKVL